MLYLSIYMILLYIILYITVEGIQVLVYSLVYIHCILGCALFYKPIWQLTVNERGHYADSEDTFLFKIEDSPDTRLGA